MDLAAPLFDDNSCPYLPEFFYGSKTKGVAKRSVAIYSNPCGMGVGKFDTGDVNLRLNPKNGYNQPGDSISKLSPFYNHAFSTFVFASLCNATKAFDDNDVNRSLDLNFLYNEVSPGTYSFTVNKCWPFFCY